MPRYLIERDFGNVTDEEMEAAATRSRDLISEHFPEVTWEHSHVCAGDAGVKTFCVYGAPDEEVVRRHADQLGGHSITALYELVGDVSPADLG